MNSTQSYGQTRQLIEETPLENASRTAAGFQDVEAKLPKLWDQSDMDLVDKLTSLLGNKNPFSRRVQPDVHTVWLLDNAAYRPVDSSSADPQPWQAEFIACYFNKNRKDISKKIAAIADAIGIDGKIGVDQVVTARIAERIGPFVNAIAPAHRVAVKIPNPGGPHLVRELGPSNAQGISTQDVITATHTDVPDGTVVETKTVEPFQPPVLGKTRFIAPTGWSIISDIDDTIKWTQTTQPEGILRTTFAEEPKPIEDMPALYTTIQDMFANPAWFYLSASPYNLYPFLGSFLEDNYPGGVLILRDDSWQELSGLLKSLTQGVKQYKTSRMDRIHAWFPTRKFICFGDSTQSDPEAYGEIYRKYGPEWVKGIFIRKVTYVEHMEEKNKPERFEKAFEGIPRDVWQLFEQPAECETKLKELADGAALEKA